LSVHALCQHCIHGGRGLDWPCCACFGHTDTLLQEKAGRRNGVLIVRRPVMSTLRKCFIATALCMVALHQHAPAQTATAPTVTADSSTFKPKVGQSGKDVIWVPTSQVLVDRMLDAARLTSSDYLVDLGSGDGRTVI